MKLPSISVITPSFNQGHFIKRTIDSVLNQKYPDLEYIVIDGGSTDDTIEILKSYGKKISWISEKDNGQTDAINKGLKRAKGDVLAYLNSDDIYLEGTLASVGEYFSSNPDVDWLTGGYEIIDEHDRPLRSQSIVKSYKAFMMRFYSRFLLRVTNSLIPQPSTFWSRKAYETVGEFDESLRYCMDYDYWLRLSSKYKLHQLNQCLSGFRVHADSKSTTGYDKQFTEELDVLMRNGGTKIEQFLHSLHTQLVLSLYKRLK